EPGGVRGRRPRPVVAAHRWAVPELQPAAPRRLRARTARRRAGDRRRRAPDQPDGTEERTPAAALRRGRADGIGADAGRRRGPGDGAGAVRRRTVRDRLQPGLPARRAGERRERRDRAEADQPAAAGSDRIGRRWGIPLPDHAHPPQRVIVAGAHLRDFRSYADERVSVAPGLTVVHGANGAGKTNLLEALYFGATARSCRTTNEREV